MKKGSRRRKRARVPGRARRGSTKGRRNIISFSATPETKLGRWKEVCVCVCVCVRGVGQKSAVKKHTRRYTTASRRQWPPRGKVSITGGGRDNGHSKKRMFGPHNDGQRNDLSAYMLHTAACYKYPDVCPMDLDGGGRINRLSRENRLPRDENERKCFAAR